MLLLWSHFPSGNSIYQFQQYLQFVKSKRFQTYDFGKKKNLKYYGSENPLEYNLTNVKIPSHLFYATNDLLYNKAVKIEIDSFKF